MEFNEGSKPPAWISQGGVYNYDPRNSALESTFTVLEILYV